MPVVGFLVTVSLGELRVIRCVDSYGLLQMEVAMTGIQKAPNHPLIASDRIEGTLVRRPNGEKIGKIKRLMIDKEGGTIAYAVMSFGGSMRMRVTFPTNNWLRPFCPIDSH